MFAIPLYFQVTARASNTVAGAHLFPAVAGNAVGGLLAGATIKRYSNPPVINAYLTNPTRRTGQYKKPTLLAILAACGAYLLLILRWHGHTNWLESLYIIPGGFAMGVAGSTLFISVQASIDPAYSAVAASTLYLASSTGSVIGMAASSAVLQGSLRPILERKLSAGGFEGSKKLKVFASLYRRCWLDLLMRGIDHRAGCFRCALCGARQTRYFSHCGGFLCGRAYVDSW